MVNGNGGWTFHNSGNTPSLVILVIVIKWWPYTLNKHPFATSRCPPDNKHRNGSYRIWNNNWFKGLEWTIKVAWLQINWAYSTRNKRNDRKLRGTNECFILFGYQSTINLEPCMYTYSFGRIIQKSSAAFDGLGLNPLNIIRALAVVRRVISTMEFSILAGWYLYTE